MLRNLVITSCALLLLAGCSTKKNNWTNRAYHNVTSEFNVKFNAAESFKQGVKKAEALPAPDYNELLPVFVFAFEGVPNQVTSEMDRTIDKCSKLITQHSITAKPKKPTGKSTQQDREFYNQREFNRVVDDAYLLMGKASLYLQKYDQAITLFDYMLLEYPKTSAIPEAKLWQAVALTNAGELDRVEKLLAEARESGALSKVNTANLHAAYANYYIKKNNYEDACRELSLAVNDEPHKSNRIRYHFILAYLYGHTNNPTLATKHLQEIINTTNDYEQEFSAELLLAGSFEPSKAQLMKKNLLKMAKDPHNEDYLDRIYFALARVEQVMGNDSAAIAYLELTVSTESLNPRQNGLAYEALGDYYYNRQRYPEAYKHLSAAAEILGAGYPRYNEIATRTASLQKLALNWEIVHREDSLQRIAKLPAGEREQLITQAIQKVTEDEQKAAEAEQQRQFFVNRQEQQRYSSDGNTGKWYFYNPNSINAGTAAFNIRWGKRRLEDNWRRKDRSEMAALSNEQEEPLNTDPAIQPPSNKTREYYTRDLPLTPELMKTSDDQLRPALFRLGEAYMNDVHEAQKAINTFEELIQRYPENEYMASTYYYLYKLYNEAGSTSQSMRYKDLMVTHYPQAPLTQSVVNPNYMQEQRALQEKIEGLYETAFTAYNQGRYAEANELAGQISTQYPQNFIQAQIALLKAFCTAKTSSIGAYKQALTAITTNFPGSETAQTATQLLAGLESNALQYTPTPGQVIITPTPATPAEAKTIFTADKGAHYFAILFDSRQNSNELLFSTESYNVDQFLDKNYDVSITDLHNGYMLLLVKTFGTRDAAIDYALGLYDDKALEQFDPVNFRRMLITPGNLELLEKSKAVVDYLEFFNTQYLTNGLLSH